MLVVGILDDGARVVGVGVGLGVGIGVVMGIGLVVIGIGIGTVEGLALGVELIT